MKPVTFAQVRDYRMMNGLPWFTTPWNINFFVVRSDVVSQWDNLFVAAFYDDASRECLEQYHGCSTASSNQWINPKNPAGCVYIRDGHYPGGYRYIPGGFNGRDALMQVANFDYSRWPPDKGYVPTVAELDALPSFNDNCSTHLHNRYNYLAPPQPEPNESEGCPESLYQHQHAGLCRVVQTQGDAGLGVTVSVTFVKRSALEPYRFWGAPVS